MRRLAVLIIVLSMPLPAVSAEATQLEPVVVTASGFSEPLSQSVFSITRLGQFDIDLAGATHPNELFSRVPATWISRGSGQEHLTAIRSPVLTGAGACGAFLYLEDGIPVRPAGFCNVNQLFEINTEQADAIEVLRGPGSVLYGSNALHGVINVLHSPLQLPLHEIQASAGAYGYRRLAFDYGVLAGDDSARAQYFGETADSIQQDASHEQHKLNLGALLGEWRLQVAATSLDQDTAGYIKGEDAYRDSALAHSNPNPEAFRTADSLRAWATWEHAMPGGRTLTLKPYARYSDMDFLQHFLPGKPLEENGQTSAGMLARYSIRGLRADWTLGMDVEWANGWLTETQANAVEIDSDFLRATRPVGKHYEYTVTQYYLSPWLQLESAITDDTTLITGGRADWIRYDYDNRLAAGNARDDGSACGFGGCIYNRPADRSDTFETFSPKLGLLHALDGYTLYANAVHGFRVPQVSELYRLQRGQDVADLAPVGADSVELGLRTRGRNLAWDVALYAMRKTNVIFRDAEGFNVSSGKTRHRGVEVEMEWQFLSHWQFALDGTYARHTYDFDYRPAEGEQFVTGGDVDTAPRSLGSAFLRWSPDVRRTLELEYAHMGAYWLDAENAERYPGHELVHIRWSQRFDDFELGLRIMNLLDKKYAERADYAFGDFRYFPGWPRRISADIAWHW